MDFDEIPDSADYSATPSSYLPEPETDDALRYDNLSHIIYILIEARVIIIRINLVDLVLLTASGCQFYHC